MAMFNEHQLLDRIRSLFKAGWNGDWEHTRRTVSLGKYLLQYEKGDMDVVDPALYLHDLGWTQVDFTDFKNATPAMKKDTKSVFQHMGQGAFLADKILTELKADKEIKNEIVSIISVHDLPEKIFSMNNLSATLVVEADRLDRYGKQELERFKKMFGTDKLEGRYWEEAKKIRRDGLDNWFRTKTARELSNKLAYEMDLFE